MKQITCLAIFAALGLGMGSKAIAESMTPAEKTAFIEALKAMQSSAESKERSRLRSAIDAFSSAAQSDTAAVDLYLKCIEKSAFEDKDKKASDFREWKKSQGDRLTSKGFGKALQLQLQFLILTLNTSEKAEARDPGNLEEVLRLTAMAFEEADSLGEYANVLRESPLGTVFARVYGVETVKREKWPTSVVNLESIFEELVFPKYRKNKDFSGLRRAWEKRMNFEKIALDSFTARKNDGRARMKGAVAKPTEASSEFMDNQYPALKWRMEMDCFKSGDEVGASRNMANLIKSNSGTKFEKEWVESLITLLKNPAEETTPASKTEKPARVEEEEI